MRQIQLPGTALRVSRFSFGTASLHHLGGAAEQVRHLHAARDAGCSHFDTAPLYGFGSAERALGAAFPGKEAGPSGVSIATKVGLYPPGGTVQGRAQVWGRKALGRVWPVLSRAQADWAVDRAKQSFEGSLARLNRDRVDLLLLHEPDILRVTEEPWMRWLEDEIARGRVGQIGVSGTADKVAPFVAAASPLAAFVQTHDSLSRCEADFLTDAARPLQITYGYQSAPAPDTPDAPSRAELLAQALARNSQGSILVSTRKPERLAVFAEAAAQEPTPSNKPGGAPC